MSIILGLAAIFHYCTINRKMSHFLHHSCFVIPRSIFVKIKYFMLYYNFLWSTIALVSVHHKHATLVSKYPFNKDCSPLFITTY